MKNGGSKKDVRRQAGTAAGTKHCNKTTAIQTTTVLTTIENINSSKQSKAT